MPFFPLGNRIRQVREVESSTLPFHRARQLLRRVRGSLAGPRPGSHVWSAPHYPDSLSGQLPYPGTAIHAAPVTPLGISHIPR